MFDKLLEKKISRKDFLKKTGLLTAGVVAASKIAPAQAMTFSDNLIAGTVIGAIPPESTKNIWIDTTHDGLAKYYDATTATWKPIRSEAVWG